MGERKYWLAVFVLLVFAGCTTTTLPLTGTIYTDIKGSLDMDPAQVDGQMVEGRAMVKGILGFATGDCSIEAAIKDALSKAPGKTKLVNTTIDYHSKTILSVYTEFTTIVKGVAVK